MPIRISNGISTVSLDSFKNTLKLWSGIDRRTGQATSQIALTPQHLISHEVVCWNQRVSPLLRFTMPGGWQYIHICSQLGNVGRVNMPLPLGAHHGDGALQCLTLLHRLCSPPFMCNAVILTKPAACCSPNFLLLSQSGSTFASNCWLDITCVASVTPPHSLVSQSATWVPRHKTV